MKIVINNCYGGFGCSEDLYKELGIKWDGYGYLDNDNFGIDEDYYNAYRGCSKLIEAIEKIGEEKASNSLSKLLIVDIPDDVDWEISEYNGMEHVAEKHRTWYGKGE